MWTVPALCISDDERRELQRRVRAHTTTQRDLKRAREVLLAADGVANRRIAKEVGLAEGYVGMWGRRFETHRLKGLEDLLRSGRPRMYGQDERLKIVAAATSQRPEFDSQWSHRLLANYLDDLGIAASQGGRVLAEVDIQ